jgi:hypothetical protein
MQAEQRHPGRDPSPLPSQRPSQNAHVPASLEK